MPLDSMMNTMRAYLTRARSRIFTFLGSLFPLASSRSKPREFREEPDYYKAGGYHPISLGDTLDSERYTVLRKLGYGEYSTVWLARDSKCERYVALKILRADSYDGEDDIFEREILEKITDVSQTSSHEGRNYVSGYLDIFNHTGPNGDHVCFVFDILGYHLGYQVVKYEWHKLPVKSVKVITRQILVALDFLHNECGVIHTDLKPSNILLELETPQETVSQYLADVPTRTGLQRGTTRPLQEVITTPLISEMKEPRVKVIDFGVASWKEKHLAELIQSDALRAPEVTIEAPWDEKVDIWSLGCLVLEFVQGITLFLCADSPKGTWTAEDDQLGRMAEVLGPFPLEFIKKGKRYGEFFDEKGNLLRIPALNPSSLEVLVNGDSHPRLARPSDMPEAEVPVFIDFLKCMLEIDPVRRKSATELLQHEWLAV